MKEVEYNRKNAVSYAHKWAYERNPQYFNFDTIGGDCTNFTSQVIFAGCKIMNYNNPLGWYYKNINNRAPAWSGVEFLYKFLTTNKGIGPYGIAADAEEVLPGDILQLSFDGVKFSHCPNIVAVGEDITPDSILLSAHSFNCDNRPLSSYSYEAVRFVHILGARK